MAKRIKIYEEKRQEKAIPLWAWILGLVVVITVLVLFFTHGREHPAAQPAVTPVSALHPASPLVEVRASTMRIGHLDDQPPFAADCAGSIALAA